MPEDILIQISARLREMRKDKNVTLQELAEEAGVTKSLVSQIENGRSIPSLPVLLNLIKALALDFNQFFKDIDLNNLADTTVVVMVPEAGDEVQTMKAGLMEIADVFVVNKADRPDADMFARNLRLMMAPAFYTKKHEIAIIKTEANNKKGIDELAFAIDKHLLEHLDNQRRYWLLAEKAWQLIQAKRMAGLTKNALKEQISSHFENEEPWNIYRFIKAFE
jgi:LAO/AO transport system kinase